MAKKEPVNLRRQTIFAIIPYLNLYAIYRVQKLRKYFLIAILISVAATIILSVGVWVYVMLIVDSTQEDLTPDILLIFESIRSLPAYLIYFSSGILLNVYLVRKWSRDWNNMLSGKKDPEDVDRAIFTG